MLIFNFYGNGGFFILLYSTLRHLPPLRFHCVAGCWDWTQDCFDFAIGIQISALAVHAYSQCPSNILVQLRIPMLIYILSISNYTVVYYAIQKLGQVFTPLWQSIPSKNVSHLAGIDPGPPAMTAKRGVYSTKELAIQILIWLFQPLHSCPSLLYGCRGLTWHRFRGLTHIHRKKRFMSFPSPAWLSVTKLPLGRNNSVMTSLFPPRESLVVTSRLGTGNSRTFFLRCT